jgi:cation transport regulator
MRADRGPLRLGPLLRDLNETGLPESVRNNLPRHAREIYGAAFNSAEEQYGEEGRAHRVAWGAVEQKYEKNDKGNWVQKGND